MDARMITVALPVFNAKKIVWLAMEGLCRQETNEPWELLICEEKHPLQTGKALFDAYLPRLKAAGCISMQYIELPQWVNLPKKWSIMAQRAKGDIFILQAADCFSDSSRLARTREIMGSGHWYFDATGHFYNVTYKKLALYKNFPGRTGLNMALKTDLIRDLPDTKLNKNIDRFLFTHISKKVKIVIRQNKKTQLSLDVDGMNNISKSRHKLIAKLEAPFYAPTLSLGQILPKDILKKLI